MTCAKCGGELRETAKFCPWCGEKVEPVPEESAEVSAAAAEIPEDIALNEAAETEENIIETETTIPPEDIEAPAVCDNENEPALEAAEKEASAEEDTASTAETEAAELAVEFEGSDDLYVVSEQPAAADIPEQNETRPRERTVRFSFRYGTALIAAAFITIIGITAVFVVPEHIIPYMKYRKAEKFFADGDIAAAEDIFSGLDGYRSSAEYIQKCHYSSAAALMDNGDFEQAAKAFAALDGYADSDELASECLVHSAENYAAAGDFDSAISAYYMAGKPELAEDTAKARAEFLMESGDFFAAAEAAEKYSHEKALEYLYEGSKNAMQNGDLENAVKGFEKLGDNRDSEQLLRECNYMIYAGDYSDNGANAANVRGLYDMGNYRGAEKLFEQAAYEYGNELFDSGKYYEAYLMFMNVVPYENSGAMLYRCRYELGRSLESSDPDSAYSIFSMLGNYSDSAARKRSADKGGSGWYADGCTSENGFYTSVFSNSDTLIVSCTAGTDKPAGTVTLSVSLNCGDDFTISADCEDVRNSGFFSASISLASAPAGNAEVVVSVKDSGEVLRRFEITIE